MAAYLKVALATCATITVSNGMSLYWDPDVKDRYAGIKLYGWRRACIKGICYGACWPVALIDVCRGESVLVLE